MSVADPRPDPPAGALWPPERLVRRRYAVLVVLLAVAVLANEVALFATEVSEWDWLLVSGVGTLLAAAYFSLLLPDRVTETVTRLTDRGVLSGPVDPVDFLGGLHRAGRRNGLITVPVFVGLVVAGFAVAFGDRFGRHAVLAAAEAVAAVPVGLFVGRAVTYGTLGRRLTTAGVTVTPNPDHLDGVAGLRPVGDLYFYQAKLLAIPGIYLAAWWILIPLFGDRYLRWREPYVGFLGVVVIGEVLVFVLPMIWFHRLMARRRTELLPEADELSGRSARAAGGATAADATSQERYTAIETMPTWPVGEGVRRRFGLGNVLLVLPVLAQVLGASQGTQELLDQLSKVISGRA